MANNLIQHSHLLAPRLGRPRKDSKEIMELLRLGLSFGYSLDKACRKLGLNKKTVYVAMHRDPWLAEEIEKYRNLSLDNIITFREILYKEGLPLLFALPDSQSRKDMVHR